MRSAILSFVAILLAVPGLAQMRSTNSASPIHGGRPHPPGVILRPGFGRHFHENRFGPAVYPFGLYDGYEVAYPELQQPPPVVVVRDERSAAPPAAPVQIAPVEPPKMIEVPEAVPPRAGVSARTPPAIFIFADGQKIEARNYTVTDSLLTIQEPYRPAIRVPLNQLNIEATLAENHQRGLELQIPESKSEILVGF